MATYEDERKKQEQAAMSGTQQQNTQQPAQQPDNTQYQATMQALEGAKTQAPVYGGQYDQQIQDIYQQIVNRKKFSYDAASAAAPADRARRQQDENGGGAWLTILSETASRRRPGE